MEIGNLSATNTIKAIKTRKALNVGITEKTIVFFRFFLLYSGLACPDSL